MSRSNPIPPVFLGVRHHSPACARLVRAAIRRMRPSYVLIEGPSDFNPRIDELFLGHELPIAIFSYLRREDQRHTSWTPFCEYSPEWIALETAREIDAKTLFCDLPSWHEVFGDLRNRYADRRGDQARSRAEKYLKGLCERLAIDDSDTLWDHLFEQPMPEEELAERLGHYFEHLRGQEEVDPHDTQREQFMACAVAWAVRRATEDEDGGVLVVCGGYHAPVLARLWETIEPGEDFPIVEAPDDALCESYLVPYGYKRLDSFAGYQSGMPSPAFYEALWREGPEAAGERALEHVVERLRKKKQPVSTADLIAATSLARGLARMRGHAAPIRTDLLDAIAGALVKDGLEVPLPWSRRGPIPARTDPLLVEVVAALSGERRGRLAEETPRPPLLRDVLAQLEEHQLQPERRKPREVKVDLTKALGRNRSRLLHRLSVLGVSGFHRLSGPEHAEDAALEEVWRLRFSSETEIELIEASSWGPTLHAAATACLEESLSEAEDLTRSAELLSACLFIGADALAEHTLERVSGFVAVEPSFSALGAATRRIYEIWRHDGLFSEERRSALSGLDEVVEACFDRGLWLLEGLLGADDPASPSRIDAVAVLRDLARRLPEPSPTQASDVFQRRAVDAGAPPGVRGACLGALWSATPTVSALDPSEHAARAVRSLDAAVLGDFLAGLFALAREETLSCDPLLEAIDAAVTDLDLDVFLTALPALRLAFSYFPPLELELLARFALRRHGDEDADPYNFLHLPVAPMSTAQGVVLDEHVAAIAARYGLLDQHDLDRDEGDAGQGESGQGESV